MENRPFSYRENSRRAGQLRDRVYARSGDKCVYCDRSLVDIGCIYSDPLRSIDHDIPTSRGGDDSESNLVACCMACNSQKRNLTGSEYRVWREARKT
ncbi:HNH endonuclease [Brevundimonas vesicularis]